MEEATKKNSAPCQISAIWAKRREMDEVGSSIQAGVLTLVVHAPGRLFKKAVSSKMWIEDVE